MGGTTKTYKIALVGDRAGKTAWLHRHATGQFLPDCLITYGTHMTPLRFHTSRGEVRLEVLDIGRAPDGRTRLEYATQAASTADATMVFFSVADLESFAQARRLVSALRTGHSARPMVVCGNKVDLKERVVAPNEIAAWSRGCQYYDVSAKTLYNFEKPFLCLLRAFTGDGTLIFVERPPADAASSADAAPAAAAPPADAAPAAGELLPQCAVPQCAKGAPYRLCEPHFELATVGTLGTLPSCYVRDSFLQCGMHDCGDPGTRRVCIDHWRAAYDRLPVSERRGRRAESVPGDPPCQRETAAPPAEAAPETAPAPFDCAGCGRGNTEYLACFKHILIARTFIPRVAPGAGEDAGSLAVERCDIGNCREPARGFACGACYGAALGATHSEDVSLTARVKLCASDRRYLRAELASPAALYRAIRESGIAYDDLAEVLGWPTEAAEPEPAE